MPTSPLELVGVLAGVLLIALLVLVPFWQISDSIRDHAEADR